VHYQIVRPEGDHTGVRLKLTRAPQPMSAGMMTYAVGFVVPPRKESHLVPNACCYSGFQPLTGFAFRVHAHALGRCVVSACTAYEHFVQLMSQLCSVLSTFGHQRSKSNSNIWLGSGSC